MNHQPEHHFLDFTKKERNGILLLTGIILVLILLPRVYPLFTPAPPAADTAFQRAIASLKVADSNDADKKEYETYSPRSYNNAGEATTRGELFAFDPNTLSPEGWKKLGLKDKTIATIQKYISKGGRFRSPEDIHKVWGLRLGEADRLQPYVRIASAGTADHPEFASPAKPAYTRPVRTPVNVDINQADTTAFIALPGIGSKLAGRIITFRDKLGGFYSTSQVGEVFGLADSVFQKIKPYLQLTGRVKQVNINTATLEEMKQHPYIRYQLANAIVQYRQQHGAFVQTTDIRNIMMVTEDVYRKVLPYLTVQP